MGKAALALLALAFLQPTLAAQTTAWADKLFGGTIEHNFGTVPRGAQLKHSFKMTNIYKVPLEITNIRVSCGCLTATPTKKMLQPGETGSFDIHMDGTRFQGYKKITIFVTVGPEYVSTATLYVIANARLDVVFTPGEIDFGLVQRGQAPTKTIDVEYFGAQAWQVSEIIKNSACPFDLKVEELKGRAQRGYRIMATLKTDAPAGSFKHEIVMKTNDPASPLLTFHVVGNVLASLKVSPSSVSLATKVGDMKATKVVISGSQAFRITAVDGQGDGISAEFPDQEATTHIVEIRYQPTKAGELKRQLSVRTSIEKESVTVSVEASGTP